jgi:3-oxoacyl-[acyl-carrier protein] reductase
MRYKVFENKNCFITGATGGIGEQIAKKMAENRCNLFLTSTNLDKLENLKEEIKALNESDISVFYEDGDVNEIEHIRRIISGARERFGSIDIVVNCAGIFKVKYLTDYDLDDFDTTVNINVRAPFIFCKEFSNDMKKSGWGRIVNFGSSSAYTGTRKTSLYCSSKHALLGFSRALHEELKEYNIRTFCVSPAGAKTTMGKLIENHNFNTFLDPKEIAEYVAFICSFDNEMISEEIRLSRMIKG